MITKHTYKSLTWLDVESPTPEEAKEIMETYDVHPFVADEILSPTQKPHLDSYDNYLYLVLHFPAIKHTHSNQNNQEIDFIIGKNILITTRYDTIDSLHTFKNELEMDAVLDDTVTSKHAGFMFYYMIRALYASIHDELEYIESELSHIEENVFNNKEREMVHALSDVSHNLLDIKQTLQHHGDILEQLEQVSKKFFTPKFADQLKTISTSYKHVQRIIGDHREVLYELRTTNDSLLSTKQNEVMKNLTVMAFVMFPLSLIAALFGMNTTHMPFIGNPGDFWIIIGIMAALTVVLFLYFKHRKWL